MQIFALGLNHLTAPLELREKLAFPAERLSAALAQLARSDLVHEVALLSTCNRTELYGLGFETAPLVEWLANHCGVELEALSPALYLHEGREAVRHLFRVACGLDSMVLGETQILGQLKAASRAADEAGSLSSVLHKLLQTSFSVAKEVRSNTAIGTNIVSMAAAAVELASGHVRLDESRLLFVGAGEMIHLCSRHFMRVKPARVTVANRSLHRAEVLASEIGGSAVSLLGLEAALAEADVVVACTGSAAPLIDAGMVERALRERVGRPLVIVDLGVPRDVAPAVAALPGVFLHDIDGIMRRVAVGRDARRAAVEDAEAIIDARLDAFMHWLQSRAAVPTIQLLREHAERLRQAELARARRLLAHGEDPLRVLDLFSQAIANKMLHGPIHYLNQADEARLAGAQAHIRQVFLHDSRNLFASGLSQPTKVQHDS